jgi:hypothetical protein
MNAAELSHRLAATNFYVAIHEAGHAVVALELGRRFTAISIDGDTGMVEFVPLAIAWQQDDPGPEAQAAVRRLLTVNVAGCVAVDLQESLDDWGEWPSPENDQLIAALGETPRPRLLSTVIRQLYTTKGNAYHDLITGSDHDLALSDAHALFFDAKRKRRICSEKTLVQGMLAEIRQAEVQAEAILKQRWEDVGRLARSLCRRRSHRLTEKQALYLLRKR